MGKMIKLLMAIACVGIFQLGWGEMTNFLQKPAEYAEIIKKDDIQLVDVRKPDEFSAGTIGNAQNINVLEDDFVQKISVLDKEKPVYIFCRSGARSEKARNLMLEAGFKEVYDLEGGYLAWEKMTKEVEAAK